MNNKKFTDFQILDCTVRDGGYVNDWKFDKKFVREVYRALSKASVDFVEIGFKGTEKYFDREKYGLWRFSEEKDIHNVTANISGSKLAIMADYGKIETEDFCNANESLIELVRVAVHKDDVKGALSLLEQIKKKGYKVSLNVMGYTNYSKTERNDLVDLLKTVNLDYVYIADTYGSLFPNQVSQIFEPLLEISQFKVGFHSHNNLQMAFANTLEAVSCGVHIIDSTIYGMGRGAGNLPTEVIISFVANRKGDKYNPIPILNIIDRFFVEMQNHNRWGYQLPYMLSGLFQCHPNYPKALMDLREYTIEDIWKAMSHIKKKNPVGFSKSLLDDLIKEGVIGSGKIDVRKNSLANSNKLLFKIDAPKISYLDKHKERDFLVLANGPSLKEYKYKIDKFIFKYDPIILGANYLGELFKPHYHAFINKRRFVAYIDTVSSSSQLLIGQHIDDSLIHEYTNRNYENIYYIDTLNSDFEIYKGVITSNCRTVSILLLGVAIVMGAHRVFVAGMDGYVSLHLGNALHFYNEKEETEDRQVIYEKHQWCQYFIDQIDKFLSKNDKEGVHIITPTSYKSFYKGIENYI
ncbi:MAG: aldolase catalytic domain-containing protein [Planctomycetes bacterium]|nr:aldolase catalytic domain-containing protein [Planctomycetota bacterium]